MAQFDGGSNGKAAAMEEDDAYFGKPLIIPVTSSTNGNNYSAGEKGDSSDGSDNGSSPSGLFVEIFPEEMPTVRPTVLARVLREERAPLRTWCDAALLYVRSKREREGCELLRDGVDDDAVMSGSNTADRMRILASAGIAALAQHNRQAGGMGGIGSGALDGGGVGGAADDGSSKADAKEQAALGKDQNDELRSIADARFTKADTINQVNPMTWIGKGMLNLVMNRMDQARFFFENLSLGQCGEILPALLGMAAVRYAERDYKGAQEMYAKAMQKFPQRSGAATRVGFGMACYQLGQIDRAKAAFRRAHEMDPECVEAMVGIAVLEMASLDDVLDAREYRAKAEKAIKMISMANLVDHNNAMVQNHLANHYFWKWTLVSGASADLERGSTVVKGNAAVSLEAGDRIRIGTNFETYVVDVESGDEENDGAGVTFRIKDPWKFPSQANLKLWKKDYDRVLSLAKGAHSSTNVPEIQAESLYILARVHHARDDMEQANKFYDKACKHSPGLNPARFGLAQTMIWDEKFDDASAHLRILLGTCTNAIDALAALGLLEVKAGKDRREAFVYLKKAIDLDPLNPDLVLIEALALQQHESDYPHALDRYRKAVDLMESQGKAVPAVVFTNIGVLCQETKRHEEALETYGKALAVLEENPEENDIVGAPVGEEGFVVRHRDNSLFWKYEKMGFRVAAVSEEGGDRTSKLTVTNSALDVESIGVAVGDHVILEGGIETEITEFQKGHDGRMLIVVKDDFPSSSSESFFSVKRSNGRLRNPSAISIAFNLARLHETAGRIVPSVELHKAIVKCHPSYVNSYLRLACIARDCGSLKDCSEWLKSAVAVAPGNAEVLTLVGNLHLSLCDWAPAQKVFDQLLTQKVPKVEAYSMLSLGNIYFNNLNTPKKYTKHLNYAADFYRRILAKDNANAYAANGLGTVLAEKGELFKAKEIFNRVREVSGDTILDTLLNLGHIYLAQKKHPEALQMYQSYMNRTRNTGAPITSKSQDEDEAEVLLYIGFAYFDWARQTELFNDTKAGPADERYKKCIEYIELAMKKSKKENVLLRYNWCMAKLQAANCVLQKLTRNIRRTAQEVQDALDGLEESLPIIQTMLQWKTEGRKVPIPTIMLTDFASQCKHNIDSAKSHLNEELKKEKEAQVLRDYQRVESEANEKQRLITTTLQKEKEAREDEARDRRARRKMDQVRHLAAGWEQETTVDRNKKAAKNQNKPSGDVPPGGVDDEAGIFDTDVAATSTSALFDDSDEDDDENEGGRATEKSKKSAPKQAQPARNETEQDLFGDSSSDEEGNDSKKRGKDDDNDDQSSKRRKVMDEEDDD